MLFTRTKVGVIVLSIFLVLSVLGLTQFVALSAEYGGGVDTDTISGARDTTTQARYLRAGEEERMREKITEEPGLRQARTKSIEINATGIYEIELAGAEGGDGGEGDYIGGNGGLGGYTKINIALEQGDELEFGIGEMGKDGEDSSNYAGGGGGGGGSTAVQFSNGTKIASALGGGGGGGGGAYYYSKRTGGQGGDGGGGDGQAGGDGQSGGSGGTGGAGFYNWSSSGGSGGGGGGGYSKGENGSAGGYEIEIGTKIDDGTNQGDGSYSIELIHGVKTNIVTDVTLTSATLQGNLTLPENKSANVSFNYREVGETVWDETPSNTMTSGEFNETLSGLNPLTKYEFKAIMDLNGTVYEGKTLVFMTGKITGTTQLEKEWNNYVEAENVTTDGDDLVLAGGEDEGYRISEPISLQGIVRAGESVIEWNSTEPAGTNMTIYTALTDSDEIGPTKWNESMNGDAIPGIGGGENLSDKYLWTKQVLTTNDTGVIPRLHRLSKAITLTDPDHIEILPQESTVTAGDAETYQATAYDEFDNAIQDVTSNTTWEISEGAGGSWAGNVYISENAGEWTVTAEYGILTDTATLHVDPAEADHASVKTQPERIEAGQTIDPAPAVEVLDEFGNPVEGVEVTVEESGGYDFDNGTTEVQTDAEGIAAFDDLVINQTGEYALEFVVDGITEEIVSDSFEIFPAAASYIEVTPKESVIEAGDSLTFEATAYDEYGNDFEVTGEVDWSIDEGAGGSWEENKYISEYTGDWSVEGTYISDGDNLTDETIITVEPAAPSRVDIEPVEEQIIEAGETIDFSAEAYDEYGNLITDDPEDFEWDEAGESGLFNKTQAGEYEVRASYSDVTSESTLVTVEHSEADRLEVFPETTELTAGDSQEFNTTAFDEYGNDFNVTEETDWSMKGDAGGAWEGNEYRSELAGTWNVTANYEGVTGSAVVMVEPAKPARLEIFLSKRKVKSGENVTFNATAFDEYGNSIGDVREETEWSIEEGAGGTWEDNIYVAENGGTWNVTGTYEGISASEDLTVEEEKEDEKEDEMSFWASYWWLPIVSIVIMVLIIVVLVWKRREDKKSETVEVGGTWEKEVRPESKVESGEAGTDEVPLTDSVDEKKKMKKVKKVKKVKKPTDDTDEEEKLEAEIERLLEEEPLENVEEEAETESEKEEGEEVEDGKIVCPNCGEEISPDTEICYSCGKDIKKD